MKNKTIPHWEYEQLNCCLVEYSMPLLKPCYILCHEESNYTLSKQSDLLCFAYEEAKRLSQQQTGSKENFMAISGQDIRRRANWHIHIFIVQYRWQKAYVYHLLAIKNLGLALYKAIKP